MGDASTLRPVPLPTYPPPQDVEEGDTIALDLLVSADGKQKVVDYFQVRRINPDGPAAATTSTSARDYSIDDGAPHFTFDGTRVLINGKSDAGPASTTKPGSTLWIAAPNQGRYILFLPAAPRRLPEIWNHPRQRDLLPVRWTAVRNPHARPDLRRERGVESLRDARPPVSVQGELGFDGHRPAGEPAAEPR